MEISVNLYHFNPPLRYMSLVLCTHPALVGVDTPQSLGLKRESNSCGNAGKVQTVNPLHIPLWMDSMDQLHLQLSKVPTCIENTDENKNADLVCFQSYRRACLSGLVWF